MFHGNWRVLYENVCVMKTESFVPNSLTLSQNSNLDCFLCYFLSFIKFEI